MSLLKLHHTQILLVNILLTVFFSYKEKKREKSKRVDELWYLLICWSIFFFFLLTFGTMDLMGDLHSNTSNSLRNEGWDSRRYGAKSHR